MAAKKEVLAFHYRFSPENEKNTMDFVWAFLQWQTCMLKIQKNQMLGFYRLICGIQPIYHQKLSRLRWLQRLDKYTNSRPIFPCMRNLSNQGNLHLLLHRFASQLIPGRPRYPSSGVIKWTSPSRSASSLRGSGGCPRKNQTS